MKKVIKGLFSVLVIILIFLPLLPGIIFKHNEKNIAVMKKDTLSGYKILKKHCEKSQITKAEYIQGLGDLNKLWEDLVKQEGAIEKCKGGSVLWQKLKCVNRVTPEVNELVNRYEQLAYHFKSMTIGTVTSLQKSKIKI